MRNLAFVTAAAVLMLPAPLPAQNVSPERYQTMAKDILREMIEANTTVDEGSTVGLVRGVERRLLQAGFAPADLFIAGPIPEEPSLVVRLRGRSDTRKPILLLAHIDVVAARADDWSEGLDPFVFTERNGWFYGRGTVDDKDEAAIYVTNLIRMKEEGFVPDRDVIVALTGDEEGGDHNGVAWLIANHRDRIDAAYALNEGGGGTEQDGRRISNNVQASEKVYLSFTFEATNPGGHSSLPRADNAIYDLSRALTAVSEHRFPVVLNEVTRAYFTGTAETVGGTVGDAMRRVLADQTDVAAVAVLEREPAYNSRLRTTCVATELSGGHAPNALPQRAAATVNCRILPGEDPVTVHATLQRLAGDRVTVSPQDEPNPSPPSPLTEEVFGPSARSQRRCGGFRSSPS